MKKRIGMVLAVIILAIMACGGDPSSSTYQSRDERCDSVWAQMNVEAGFESETVTLLLNQEWPPDSVGDAVKSCIDSGWTGWR